MRYSQAQKELAAYIYMNLVSCTSPKAQVRSAFEEMTVPLQIRRSVNTQALFTVHDSCQVFERFPAGQLGVWLIILPEPRSSPGSSEAWSTIRCLRPGHSGCPACCVSHSGNHLSTIFASHERKLVSNAQLSWYLRQSFLPVKPSTVPLDVPRYWRHQDAPEAEGMWAPRSFFLAAGVALRYRIAIAPVTWTALSVSSYRGILMSLR